MRLLVSSSLLLLPIATASDYPIHVQVPRQIRRFLNVGSLFGSATQSDTPYDRVGGHPVFSVTTPWGSPYMNMEKVSDIDRQADNKSKPQSVTDESNEYRTVCLYFMDPDDALGVHGEMKQMDNMQSADLRLTSFSLAKALRQASNLGGGLLTGQPPDPLTGNLPSDSGSLRYKIVPPKRQLYYAARCIGRERVGLFSDNPTEDAQAAVLGGSAIDAARLERRRSNKENKSNRSNRKQQSALQVANAHMEGYTGIPVFWNPQMQRTLPLLKRLATGVQHEIPMFFNYEDMQEAWQTMRSRHKKANVPDEPAGVQVFNLMDLLTSIDRDNYARKQQTNIRDKVLQPLKDRFVSQAGPDLQHVTFIPSSRSIQYKEAISGRGNGKCRLRPMR